VFSHEALMSRSSGRSILTTMLSSHLRISDLDHPPITDDDRRSDPLSQPPVRVAVGVAGGRVIDSYPL